MADQDHLALLKRGVAVWNEWRRQNPHIQPDLSGAVLVETDLKEVDLRRANVRRADLSGADLRGALLDEADLSEAKLIKADLSFASGCHPVQSQSFWRGRVAAGQYEFCGSE